MKTDPRVDAYIARSSEFARPILTHLRGLVHRACPDAEETIKWGMPYFVRDGILCGMAAFKRHASFILWRGAALVGKKAEQDGMGHFGRITCLEDLPADQEIVTVLREASTEREKGGRSRGSKGSRSKPKRRLSIPEFLAAALEQHPRAKAEFETFTYSHKREYIEWLKEAKREETRQKRLATALSWIAEGKPQNWKYARK